MPGPRIAVVGTPLRFRRQETELQLPAPFHRFEIQCAVLVALVLRRGDPLLERIEPLGDFFEARHACVDDRCAIEGQRERNIEITLRRRERSPRACGRR